VTNASVLTRMRQCLRDAGYNVNIQPQENLQPNEMVILLDKVTLPVESLSTYIMEVTYSIQWLESNVEGIPDNIYKVVTTLEKGVEESTFKVNKDPDIKLLGTWYRVMIKVSYKHRVVIV